MAQTLVAGVDSSTQSTKVVVCDAETGEIVRSGRAPHPEGTEVHPDRWWEAYLAATANGLLDGVAAIAVGGQQHGMCALDETGAVVRDALLWNDTRSASPMLQDGAVVGRRRRKCRADLVQFGLRGSACVPVAVYLPTCQM